LLFIILEYKISRALGGVVMHEIYSSLNKLSFFFDPQLNIHIHLTAVGEIISQIFNDTIFHPISFPIQEDAPIDIPRFIFQSGDGNTTFTVFLYSIEYSNNKKIIWENLKFPDEILENSNKAINALFQIMKVLNKDLFYQGTINNVKISIKDLKENILTIIREYTGDKKDDAIEIHQRKCYRIDDMFYSSILIKDYKIYENLNKIIGPLPLSESSIKEKGIELIFDYNDRLSFNEKHLYRSTKEISDLLLKNVYTNITNTLKSILEE